MAYLEHFDATAETDRFLLVRNWLDHEALPFVSELREKRPILETPVCTFVADFADVVEVLRVHQVFTVKPYEPKMTPYLMSVDDTPMHFRDKSAMSAFLDRADIPRIRALVAKETKAALDAAGGTIEVISGLARHIPIRVVEFYFGLIDAPPGKLAEWSFWNQYDAFHNHPWDIVPDRKLVSDNVTRCKEEIVRYLAMLVAGREAKIIAHLPTPDDIVTRVMRTHIETPGQYGIQWKMLNLGGLLIGTVETSSQATSQALAQLMNRPRCLASAQASAQSDDPTEFDGYVWEALRFDPISPYLFRQAESAYVLGAGRPWQTQIAAGTAVLPLILAAMHDPVRFPNPGDFDPTRTTDNTFHFGYGLHECMGRYVGAVVIPEIIRQVLLRKDLKVVEPLSFMGKPFPERFVISWDPSRI
jgi:cytochrome P450